MEILQILRCVNKMTASARLRDGHSGGWRQGEEILCGTSHATNDYHMQDSTKPSGSIYGITGVCGCMASE